MRRELGLGVNAFLRLSEMSKGTYYRRRRQAQAGPRSSPSRSRPKQEAIRGPAREIALTFPAYGYRKVWAELLRRGIQAKKSTVYRVLKAKRLLLPMKRRPKAKRQGPESPKSPSGWASPSAPIAPHHEGCPALGGYRIQNVIEEERRYLLASVAGQVGEGETARLAKEAMERAREEARRLGFPTQGLLLRTDRGSAFQSEAFRGYLCQPQIGQVFVPVGRPQGIGKIERLHRSLKEEKLMREELRDPLELQRALDEYRHFYNTRRLHQALGYRTPLEVVESKRVKVVSFS
ncbi:integrase core domain-containing protein [Allomeiothermus silvanus]|uniref:integrase core domain-containing protein n=1 Tax=Allomeiothermus silvanus TaxID=52022 RepID=UPI0023F27B48|nr:integrase core domain-containing protein [Allomeiothermus silvanus]